MAGGSLRTVIRKKIELYNMVALSPDISCMICVKYAALTGER